MSDDKEARKIPIETAPPLTEAQVREIWRAADRLDEFCHGWPLHQICSALFIIAAKAAVEATTSSDDEILAEFRKCLTDARTPTGATVQ